MARKVVPVLIFGEISSLVSTGAAACHVPAHGAHGPPRLHGGFTASLWARIQRDEGCQRVEEMPRLWGSGSHLKMEL